MAFSIAFPRDDNAQFKGSCGAHTVRRAFQLNVRQILRKTQRAGRKECQRCKQVQTGAQPSVARFSGTDF